MFKEKIIFLIICIFLITPANADDSTIIIGLGDCKKLIEHRARGDVYFKGGYDVRGKKVAGAQLVQKEEFDLQSILKFEIATDIAKKYKLDKGNIVAKMTVGSVTLKNNQIFLNNYLIAKEDQLELISRCHSVLSHD